MTGQIDFSFEELPLVVQDGFEAGLVNGEAEISFQADGEFCIGKIFLDGSKQSRGKFGEFLGFSRKPIEVERGSWLYNAIHEQLENGTFKDAVLVAVSAVLEAADTPIAHLHSEHSTLHRVGV